MRNIFALSLVLIGVGLAGAQEPTKEAPSAASLDPAIKKADDLFAADLAKAEEAFNKAKRLASETRLKVYRDRQRVTTKTGNLDQALAIKAGIEAIESTGDGMQPRPKNVVRLEGHAYALITEPATWHVARQRCVAMEGHLITIDSPAEFELVRKFITNQTVWVGASDDEKEGDWRWVTGQALSSDFLARCGIDNHEGIQHALCVGSVGNIGDHCAAYRMQYICEWDK
ncbi:MAG: C-type lectin domain-containing protein [Candidatus Saccharimonas sp.]|nr:C-type lectin domain-containing protein [Planctomycetaceae bacterium]